MRVELFVYFMYIMLLLESYIISFNSYVLPPAGKFGALFASIPFTVFAAAYCVLFGLVGECHVFTS